MYYRINFSQQNTEETTIKEYAPSFQRIKALYWNILALDGVNPMNSKPHDAWFWGYAFLGALFASFFVRQKMSYKMLDNRLKSTLCRDTIFYYKADFVHHLFYQL